MELYGGGMPATTAGNRHARAMEPTTTTTGMRSPVYGGSESEKVKGLGMAETAPLLERGAGAGSSTDASFAGAIGEKTGRHGMAGPGVYGTLPQAIAHRGFKAEFPENTMEAFRAAVAVGAHAIETDLHLSRDKVVMLSHDATLLRCFGLKEKIAECDWEYLSSLRTLRKPSSPMPRLLDLLDYLAKPELEDKWVLLDIKRDDVPEELIRRMAETLESVPTSRPWRERIVLGCWDARYIRLCQEHLPGFATAYIGWSLPYAAQLLRYDGIHFNMLQRVLVGPWGTHFIRRAQARQRKVFVWTVNDEEWMRWSLRKGVDGVITDDPALFLDVCRRRRVRGGSGDDGSGSGSGDGDTSDDVVMATARARRRQPKSDVWRWTRLYTEVIVLQVLAFVVITLSRIPFGSERKRVQRALRR